MARGIQAVAGIGPTTLSTGIPQYRTGEDQPMQMPLMRPAITPRVYPLRSKRRECQVLSSKRTRSLIKLRSTAAGPGKYGSGSSRRPDVTTSQAPSSKMAPVKIGHICRIQWRKPAQNGWRVRRTNDTPMNSKKRSAYECVSIGGSFFEMKKWIARTTNAAIGTASSVRQRNVAAGLNGEVAGISGCASTGICAGAVDWLTSSPPESSCALCSMTLRYQTKLVLHTGEYPGPEAPDPRRPFPPVNFAATHPKRRPDGRKRA